MKTISDFQKTYLNMSKGYEDERNRLREKISQIEGELTELNEHLNNLDCPSWVDELVKPIARMMLTKMPDRIFEILGPFGLNCNTSIHFTKKGDEEKKFSERNVKSITFRPTDLEHGIITVVDYSKENNRFDKGTIGEMNKGNFVTLPLPDSLDGIMKLVK